MAYSTCITNIEEGIGWNLANAGARAFDLIPFIAIGMAADYYQSGNFTDSNIEKIVNQTYS